MGQIWLKQKTKLTKKGGGGGKKRKNVILANQNSRVGVIWLLYFYSGQKWKQKKFAMKIKNSLKNHFAINKRWCYCYGTKDFFCNKKQKMWHIRILVLSWWWFDSDFITLIIHFIGGHVVFERSVFSKFSDNHFFQSVSEKMIMYFTCFLLICLNITYGWVVLICEITIFRENRKKSFFYLGGIQNLFS